ncbi:MAG: CHAT domain-containing protein, partial [Burkholderiaceae bacterium]
HSLFVAGATGAIVSLWPVSDGATAMMMDALYARLAAGETPAQALTHARRSLMAAGFAPRDWAAFVYYGAS